MPLPAGTRLGHYEIVATLGAGGMGEVYRGRDTQLDRDVALKVLPESFASDPDRLMRFTREAKTLASLNHPNIAAIYGIEERAPFGAAQGAVSASRTALVMELVEGEDLSQVIARGAMGLSDATSIAKQIADALEAAHEAGIIHRDLKPANIKVRTDGTVKVLDFGLAKAMDSAGSKDPASERQDPAPTMTSPAMTAMGLILGTAAYMSPEQARGKAVDKRADIWAFGVVLYEMLSGNMLFQGETVSDVLAAVLRADIDLTTLPPTVPSGVRHLLSRCLEKDPRRRLRDIGEARVLLESTSAVEPVAAVPARPARQWLPWAVAAIAVLALGTSLAIARPWAPEIAAPALRVTMQAGFSGTLESGLQNLFAISPDGTTLVFAGNASSESAPGLAESRNTDLYIRRFDEPKATLLSGTEGAEGPFFSPTGEWVGYFAKGKLFKVPAAGGASMLVADAPMSRGAVWGEDDVITFNPMAAPGSKLVRVSANGGGTPTALGAMAEKHETQRWPQVLPGNRAILYTGAVSVDNFDDACLVVQTLDGAPPKVVQCGGSNWTYVNSGHVLYTHAGSIFAAHFDLAKLAVIGTGAVIVDGVRSSTASGAAQFAVARDGRMVYLSRGEAGRSEAPIDIVDRQGKATRLQGAPLNWAALAFSPNGGRLAIDVTTVNARNVWIYDLSRGVIQRATFSDVPETRPIWMDDRTLTFAWATSGPPNLYRQAADGGKPERLTESTRVQYPGSWSPDGRSLAFTEIREGQGDVMILPMEGDAKTGLKPGKPVPLVATSSRESQPAFSPDGKWIAFASSETSRLQVLVTSATDPTRKVQVSIDGGSQPMWSPTSRELVFRTEESASRILFVTYDTSDGTFRPSRPALWTPARFALRSGVGDVALHPDGRRIAGTVVTSDDIATPTEPLMSLITDFFAILTGKVK
jgi:hypothetical protein